MMPFMNGMELHATLLLENRADAGRMIFMTGGAYSPAARQFLADVPNARLEKPFAPAALKALVAERAAGGIEDAK
jgi:CheY-like chemotaxis protein